jgi:hypothetical protein
VRTTLIFILVIFTQTVYSQKWKEVSMINDEATLALYEYRYLKAGQLYEKALKMAPQSDNLRYKAALAYYQSQDSMNYAITLFEQASKNIAPIGTYNYNSIKELRAPIEILYFLGRAYQAAGQYQKAEATYHSFISQTFNDDDLKILAEQQIKNLPFAELSINNPETVTFKNLGKHINNDMPNYCAVISGDGKTLAYTSSSNDGLKVFTVQKSNGGWGSPQDITWDIGGGYLKTAWLSYDGRMLYLIEDNMQQGITVSEYVEGSWTMAKRLKKPINVGASQSSVSVSKDGRTIYFTSDRLGGIGGFDIYVSKLSAKERWSTPVNLGPTVNTPLNEDFVMLSHDETKLYIGSEGHPTIGGSDIFVWEIGSSQPPRNLGYPINNAFNNNFFFPQEDQRGLLSAIRPEGQGQMDIYEVSIEKSYKLLADIDVDRNINPESVIKVQIEDTSGQKVFASSEISGKTNHEFGRFAAGAYKISFYGPEIKTLNETFVIESSDFTDEMRVRYALESNKPPVDQIIAQTQPEPEIKKEEVVPIPEEPKPIAVEPVKKEPEPIIAQTKPHETKAVITESREIRTEPKEQPKPEPARKKEPEKTAKPTEKTIVTKTESRTKIEEPKIVIPKQTKPRAGQFTIQFMALDLPITLNEVSNLGNVNIFYASDGLYRYTTGLFESKEIAAETLERVREAGYPKAFIRQIPLHGKYAIQLMALKNPKEVLEVSESISDLNMMHGSDDFYRYFIGGFETYEQAKLELPKIREMGYKQAWVRTIPKD